MLSRAFTLSLYFCLVSPTVTVLSVSGFFIAFIPPQLFRNLPGFP
ncbi:hypothetical protein 2011_scaffold13_00056 [Bacteriophage sp.]|nr:hypothetical protein 2011_scaffold13_00056 [Bacteriophage sp.]